MKSARGTELAIRVLEAGRAHGCIPRSLVAFKKYCLALRIVETFLDPDSNPAASWLPEGADETRREVATFLLTLVPDSVRGFAEPFREPDAASWARVVLDFAEQLERREQSGDCGRMVSRLVRAFRHASAPEVLAEIIHGEHVGARGTGTGKRHEAMSLNLPAFLLLLRHADPLLSHVNGVCNVVHDETLQFAAAFAQGVETFRRIGQRDILSQDGLPWRLSTGHIRSFRSANSKELVGLQAADVLAASVGRIARRSDARARLSAPEEDLAALAMADDVIATMSGTGWAVPGIGSAGDLVHLHTTVFRAAQAYVERRRARAR